MFFWKTVKLSDRLKADLAAQSAPVVGNSQKFSFRPKAYIQRVTPRVSVKSSDSKALRRRVCTAHRDAAVNQTGEQEVQQNGRNVRFLAGGC